MRLSYHPIAQHEQEMILQKLIYDHPGFQKWLQIERGLRLEGIKAQEALQHKQTAYDNATPWQRLKSILSPQEQAEVLSDAAKIAIKKLLLHYEFVFAASCDTDDMRLKNIAPHDLELERLGRIEDAKKQHFKSRMGWIGSVAADFHRLMQKDRPKYMESELRTIASWVDEPDHSTTCLSPYTGNFS